TALRHAPHSKMKAAATVAALAAVGSVSAFAPNAFTGKALSATVKSTSALQMADASGLVGKPFGAGSSVFDPLGLATKASDAELLRHQESEIKHGRIAMLAILGMAVQERFHPFFPTSAEVANSVDAPRMILQDYGWFWLLALWGVSVHEYDNVKHTYKPESSTVKPYSEILDGRVPGDLGFDPLELGHKEDSEYYNSMRLKEINNGRLAMIAVFGACAQEMVNGQNVF
uniref:light-harvesting protein XLH12 n=1 Tax=Tribonema minus TaxID=303371 RepID=UPI003FA615CC